jgi:lipopolysaccharide transport protein LptA
MAASILKFRRDFAAFAALAALAPCTPLFGAAPEAQPLPIDFSAQSSEIDYKNKFVSFRKVHIAQGNLAISADQGQVNGTGLENAFDDSRWVFHGAVKVTMEQGQLNSDDAQVTFAHKLLSRAVATGKPATFQQKIEKTDKTAKGQAEVIDYDVAKGIVHLTKDSWLSDGQNEMRGESLKYNVIAQTIVAEAAEQNNQRVHIIITPPSKPATPPTP